MFKCLFVFALLIASLCRSKLTIAISRVRVAFQSSAVLQFGVLIKFNSGRTDQNDTFTSGCAASFLILLFVHSWLLNFYVFFLSQSIFIPIRRDRASVRNLCPSLMALNVFTCVFSKRHINYFTCELRASLKCSKLNGWCIEILADKNAITVTRRVINLLTSLKFMSLHVL